MLRQNANLWAAQEGTVGPSQTRQYDDADPVDVFQPSREQDFPPHHQLLPAARCRPVNDGDKMKFENHSGYQSLQVMPPPPRQRPTFQVKIGDGFHSHPSDTTLFRDDRVPVDMILLQLVETAPNGSVDQLFPLLYAATDIWSVPLAPSSVDEFDEDVSDHIQVIAAWDGQHPEVESPLNFVRNPSPVPQPAALADPVAPPPSEPAEGIYLQQGGSFNAVEAYLDESKVFSRPAGHMASQVTARVLFRPMVNITVAAPVHGSLVTYNLV